MAFDQPVSSRPRNVEVLIIGAGPSGLSAMIKLQELGITDTLILDLGSRIGGTWAMNDYPGLRCDVPSELYSLGYAPNPEWTRTYAPQAEIQGYLERVAREYGVVDRIRLRTEVVDARWDEQTGRWEVRSADGQHYAARFFVPASGFIGEAKMPEFPGQSEFRGTMFHSGRWNHGHDLTGERVAVIGSGASAIQFLPEIQPKAGHVYSFQRTPSWVLPKPDMSVPGAVKTLFRKLPQLQKLLRETALLSLEPSLPLLMREPLLRAAMHPLGLLNIRFGVRDKAMRKQLRPDHTLGCKRPMFSNNWYPALAEPNVTVLFQGLQRITQDGVIAEDGSEHKVDTIIFGTGYAVAEPAINRVIKRADGRTLSEVWSGRPRAYMGMAVRGFPNMFLMLGPNSQNLVGSVIWTAEHQALYIARAISAIRQGGAEVVEVREAVQDAFNVGIDQRLQRLPMRADICHTYYLDAGGRNHIVWPEYGFVIKRRLSRFAPSDYESRHVPIRKAPGLDISSSGSASNLIPR